MCEELLPCSPIHVQSALCAFFLERVPWEQLDAADESLVLSVEHIYSNFTSPALLSFQATLVARLPLFSGTVVPSSAAAAQRAVGLVFGLLLAGEGGAGHPLAAVAVTGLPGVWCRCETAMLISLLSQATLHLLELSRRALEQQQRGADVRPGLSACLNVLEKLGVQDEQLWIGPILMGQLLPCAYLVRRTKRVLCFFLVHLFCSF